MLCLTRRENESIDINFDLSGLKNKGYSDSQIREIENYLGEIQITTLILGSMKVRLGFECQDFIKIIRSEIRQHV